MSFRNGAALKGMCLVAVGVLISTSALAQRGGRQEPGSPPRVSQRGGVGVGMHRPSNAAGVAPRAASRHGTAD